jgi:hypothetical protein
MYKPWPTQTSSKSVAFVHICYVGGLYIYILPKTATVAMQFVINTGVKKRTANTPNMVVNYTNSPSTVTLNYQISGTHLSAAYYNIRIWN